MSTNGLNATEDADMAELADDGEKVVTMMDVLQEQQDFDDDANAVLGASDDKDCTYSKGYIKRQAIYACLTCCTEAKTDPLKRAGVCLACSLNCHENHELVELYTKRNFRCDCGNPKFSTHPCQFTTNKTELNEDNNYNQNFSGLYCTCHRPYPDPEATEEDEMIQCIICEDWLHASHLEATVPSQDQYSEMICKGCMEKNDFLHDYSNFAVYVETADVDIVTVNGIDASETDKRCNGDTEDSLLNGKVVKDVPNTTIIKETKLDNDIEMAQEQSKETDTPTNLEENKVEEIIQSDLSTEIDKIKQDSAVIPMEADNTDEKVPENKVTESGDVVTPQEVEDKEKSTEESTNVHVEADKTMKTDTVDTKSADEIAELEMEKALLEEDEPAGNSEKDQENKAVITENEMVEKESVISEKDAVSQAAASIIETDYKTSDISSQNNDLEKVLDNAVIEKERCKSDNVTLEPITEGKMDEDVSEDQAETTPSDEQTYDVTTPSIENAKNTATNKVDDQQCQASTEDSEKQVAGEKNTVVEESLHPSEDAANETLEKIDEITKTTDDKEINDTKSISTSVTSPKPDEQSHEEMNTENEESPVVSEKITSLGTEPTIEKLPEDSVEQQNETVEPGKTATENPADIETIDASTKSTEDETNVDAEKKSIVDSALTNEECHATNADPEQKSPEKEENTNDSKDEESPINTETKSTDINIDDVTTKTETIGNENKKLVNESESTNENKDGDDQTVSKIDNKELDDQSASTNEYKRKLSTEEIHDDVSVKKAKLEELKKCVRPCGVKRVHRGATFWPSNFRQKLCTCNECLSMYKDLSVLFLTDPEDTVSAYEMLGQERINGGPTTQYERGLEALSSLDRIQQINALTEYNKMRDKLLDFLKSFKDRKEIVKEEDIKAFFAGMKPKREPDGVYFCR